MNIETMRHSCAHAVAAAIEKMYPGTKFGVGPIVDYGFYYDVETPEPLSESDLKKIEKEARKLVYRGVDYERIEMPIDEAISLFKEKGQDYKVSLLTDLKEKGTTKMSEEELQDVGESIDTVSLYKTENFVDLCRGPHVQNSKEIGAFKLTKLAGAYWRGDENNPQLQRIYGLCFETKEEITAHLHMLEEAKKRDHRKLGKELDLFTFSELVGPGLPLWTPKGTLMRNILDDYVWKLRKGYGYEKVEIPHITKKELYEVSGHWQKFSDELFKINTREGHEFAMKPMNCPHHTQIYSRRKWSYRELPQRYANTTACYRDEQTGELHGLSRVRSFSQDDAHVFCRQSQVKEEFLKIWDIISKFYDASGFDALSVRLSLHDPENFGAYLGTPELWNKAEGALREIATERGVDFVEELGEAAFYGPKVDFITKDSIGREWQVATIQLDINMPERFDLSCVNEEAEDERIVMIHAAIMGSIERYMSILIEHHAGKFPVWMSPVQIQMIPVSNDNHLAGTKQLASELEAQGLRVFVDDVDETVGKKIRRATKAKTPYILVVGDKELGGGEFTVRVRGQEEQESMPKEAFIERLMKDIDV